MSLTVRYIDVPEGAQEAAQTKSTYGQPFSDTEAILSGAEDICWATLESGGWLLDGTRRILADRPSDIGWWSSSISGEGGLFDQPPVIEITFPEPYTATGLTFTFWPSAKQWCSRLRVSWYNGQSLLDQVEASPADARWTLTRTVECFDRISITLLATNMPGQFAKVQKIQIGHVVVFGSEELLRATVLNEIDPSLCELTVDTMKIQVRNRKNYDLAPQKNQRMELSRNGQLIASQYITQVNRQASNLYTFSCQSAIGLLEDDHLGGMYGDIPLEELLKDVLGPFPFSLAAAFSQITLSGYLPVETRRQALQKIAFTIGAQVTTQGDGIILLTPLEEEVSGILDESRIFPGAQISTISPIAKLDVYAHSYTQSQEHELLLSEETVEGEAVLFQFPEPHHSYEITGGTVTESGANWVKISAKGSVTLTGGKYIHNTVACTWKNPMATAAEMGNVAAVQDVALIHAGNVQQVLERLSAIMQLRDTLTQDVVVSGHRAGQKVSSANPWGTVTQGYITGMDSTFTQTGHTASISIRGTEKAVNV